ncbi:MAG: pyridoxamine 5'-phosphate oxidase family protein [Actinomycetota bacterium]
MIDRARVRRHPERTVPDEANDILSEGLVAHVGFTDEDGPVVIPLLYGFSRSEPERIILHGSRASRAQKVLASGAPVCATVTIVDGLVFSRSAKYYSANYRSVVCFGRAREITDDTEKERTMAEMTARYFDGRTAGTAYEAPSTKDLDEITVVAFTIEERSAKARRGGPRGPHDEDDASPFSRGIIETPS